MDSAVGLIQVPMEGQNSDGRGKLSAKAVGGGDDRGK